MENFSRSFYSKTSKKSFIVCLVIAFSIWVSSDRFANVDTALVGYMISSFIFIIGMVFRISSWLERPATKTVAKRSRKNLFKAMNRKRNLKAIAKTFVENILMQKFIFKRGIYRGVQHFLISLGCLGSLAFTFGLTFQWFRFQLVGTNHYRMVAFDIPLITFPIESLFGEMILNGLNLFASMLLAGLIMAIARRIVNKDVRVTQRVEFDIVPLYILLIVTVSGLALTASYTFFDGFMHHYISLFHQVTVVFMLIYFPFGKLFHVPIRPFATAVPMNYQEIPQVETRACKGCGTPYSNDDQIEDVKTILDMQAFDTYLKDGSHLSDYCSNCRRRMRALKILNLESTNLESIRPVATNNGFHMPGFGRKRSDEFYEKEGVDTNE